MQASQVNVWACCRAATDIRLRRSGSVSNMEVCSAKLAASPGFASHPVSPWTTKLFAPGASAQTARRCGLGFEIAFALCALPLARRRLRRASRVI